MADHFTVIDYWYTFDGDIVYYIIITDVPCHIWMRYTFIEPKKHLESVIRRGLIKADDPYYCFVAGHDNEQEEAGDTLVHTFIKPAWFIGQKRWMYFWGTIGTVESPSATGIFHLQKTPDWTPPVHTRWAFHRQFNQYGTLRPLSFNRGIAQTFDTPPTFSVLQDIYLFTRNNGTERMEISLHRADEDDKPVGPPLFTRELWCYDGILDGGDGGAYPVWRHTITRQVALMPNRHYVIVAMTTWNTITWWQHFRNIAWVGPKDEGQANDITSHWTIDAGATWQYAFPGFQAFELFALV